MYDEVVAQGSGEPGSAEISAAPWTRVHQVQDDLAVHLLQESLGAGESEAIAFAQELHAKYVLIDDALARRKAEHIGLRLTTMPIGRRQRCWWPAPSCSSRSWPG